MKKSTEKSYQIVASKGNDYTKLTLSGDLSLNNVKAIKDDLEAYLNKSEGVKVLVKDVDNIDLGFIQLIQSFAWTLLKSNKQTDIEMELSPDQQKLLNNAGIKLKL
jgi:ABC-type transporter Mla MlaB component